MYQMADVIAIIMEGVKPHCNMLQQLADVTARWQIEWPPQGVFVKPTFTDTPLFFFV